MESSPQELVCPSQPGAVEVLEPRDVPLGGPRAMTVRRTLPQRQRSLIGAWCFVDHYGPDDVSVTGGMAVPPHPHTGLQTVSWLFTGEIEHADSAGNHALVRPGELNLMTAGRGISHSEYSTPATTVLHGAQLWVALPDRARFTDPGFDHFRPEPQALPGAVLRVFLGTLAGSQSPVTTHSPLLGAELMLDAGARLTLDADPSFEHGCLLDAGSVRFGGTVGGSTVGEGAVREGRVLERGQLGYLGPGHRTLVLEAGPEPVRLLLLGGAPLGESILMWWNFVGRTHGEVAAFRAAWQGEIGRPGPGAAPTPTDGAPAEPFPSVHFGLPVDAAEPPLPAPALPTVPLRPRN